MKHVGTRTGRRRTKHRRARGRSAAYLADRDKIFKPRNTRKVFRGTLTRMRITDRNASRCRTIRTTGAGITITGADFRTAPHAGEGTEPRLSRISYLSYRCYPPVEYASWGLHTRQRQGRQTAGVLWQTDALLVPSNQSDNSGNALSSLGFGVTSRAATGQGASYAQMQGKKKTEAKISAPALNQQTCRLQIDEIVATSDRVFLITGIAGSLSITAHNTPQTVVGQLRFLVSDTITLFHLDTSKKLT